MKYPPDLVDEVLQRLEELDLRPPREHLLEVLEVAFAATMLEEEGRRAIFTLALSSDVGRFAASRPFNAGEVAKLAPATHPLQTYIGVQLVDDKLAIAGLVHVGDRQFGIDNELQPDVLRVTGWRAGVLTVDFGNTRILHFAHGNAHWYGSDTEFAEVLDAPAAAAAARLGVDKQKLLREYERLAERVVLAGHGGALLFYAVDGRDDRPPGVSIPAEGTFPDGDSTLAKAFQNDEGLARDLRDARGREGGASEVLRATARLAEQKHRGALEYVARLANVDGAVVLRPDLTVVGFGATITAKAEPRRLFLEDPRGGSRDRRAISLGHFKGHRHKSAVHYCADQTAQQNTNRNLRGLTWAFAIVASQDGTLSIFGTAGDDVVVVRPLLLRRAVR